MHGREPDFEDQNDVIALIELLEISKKKKKKKKKTGRKLATLV